MIGIGISGRGIPRGQNSRSIQIFQHQYLRIAAGNVNGKRILEARMEPCNLNVRKRVVDGNKGDSAGNRNGFCGHVPDMQGVANSGPVGIADSIQIGKRNARLCKGGIQNPIKILRMEIRKLPWDETLLQGGVLAVGFGNYFGIIWC